MGKFENKKKKKKQKPTLANKKAAAAAPKRKPDYKGALLGVLRLGLVAVSLWLVELFGFFFLSLDAQNYDPDQLWPLAFGGLWAVMITALLRLLPGKAARIGYGICYFLAVIYAAVQTGYFVLFSEMMWLSDFRYASEGSDYFTVLFSYPLSWWIGIAGLIGIGVLMIWKFPKWNTRWGSAVIALVLAVAAAGGTMALPEAVFVRDGDIRYAGSDYGRMQSAEAAYDNMFNTHRLYQVCGLYQTCAKDVYKNAIYPLTPGHAKAQKEAEAQIDAYFAARPERLDNTMTGIFEGKNVVLVLMESMDDWMMGEHTPTLVKLMDEGIHFTSFYTPAYGGIRTFNSEFCVNTGSFLSSQGGYAFDYVTNTFNQSLANQLRNAGYSAKTYHYNDPNFYSRGVFSPAMGYEDYVCYADYLLEYDEDTKKQLLYDDLLLFDNAGLNADFFREGQPAFNFIITRSAHLSYKYNEVLSYWGLKKYPEYRGLTGNEETDCALLKARLVDDLFARLLEELEAKGQLHNTVIIGVTDHYTYGYKNEEALYALSGVDDALLLERTPCFIWSADGPDMEVDKVLNTSDLLPTVLNLLGVDSRYDYIGSDAFDDRYPGFVPFSDGGWICGDIAYNASTGEYLSVSGKEPAVTAALEEEMTAWVQEFIRINNLILETDYYK